MTMTTYALFCNHSESSKSHSWTDEKGQLFGTYAPVCLYTVFTAGSLLINQCWGEIRVAKDFDYHPQQRTCITRSFVSK